MSTVPLWTLAMLLVAWQCGRRMTWGWGLGVRTYILTYLLTYTLKAEWWFRHFAEHGVHPKNLFWGVLQPPVTDVLIQEG